MPSDDLTEKLHSDIFSSSTDRRRRLQSGEQPQYICRDCATAVFGDEPRCPHCQSTRPNPGWLHCSEHSDPWLGRLLDGRYLVAAPLGVGASARVYRGQAVTIRRKVAIKLVSLRHPNLKRDDLVTRHQREIDAVSRLHNPHIVSIYDVVELSADHVALVMEFVSGTTLQRLVDNKGPLAPQRACRIARQIANGLSEAHQAKMIHRDLKPENLMIDELPDGSDFAHILDFGIVHLPDNDDVSLTQGFLGTPLYASPEQFQDLKADHRSDIYSLGAVLFFMLTGKPPFPLDDSYQLAIHHVEKQPPRLCDVRADIDFPRQLKALVHCMLAKNADDRPPDLPQVIEALDRITSAHARPRHKPRKTRQTPPAMILRRPPQRSPDDKKHSQIDGVNARHNSPVQSQTIDDHRPKFLDAANTMRTTLTGQETFAVDEEDRPSPVLYIPNRPPRSLITSQSTDVTALALSQKSLITAHDDGSVMRTDLDTPESKLLFRSDDGSSITAIDVDVDETTTAVSSSTGRVSIYPLQGPIESCSIDLDDGLPVTCISLCTSSHLLATGRHSGAIDVFTTATRFMRLCSLQIDRPPRAISLSPDGYLLLVSTDDGSLGLYQIPSGQPMSQITPADATVVEVNFTPDGSPIALAYTDDEYRLLHLKNITDPEAAVHFRCRRR